MSQTERKEREMDGMTAEKCPTCKGTGRGPGPDVKAESPVAPGLMVWQHPPCPECGGSGEAR